MFQSLRILLKISRFFKENVLFLFLGENQPRSGHFFEKFLKEKRDKYGQEILDSLTKDKKLNFSINKHTELFITKNQKDIIKVIKSFL